MPPDDSPDIPYAEQPADAPSKFAYSRLFDLPESNGLNESERLLSQLCRKSFLSLWSYPNLHTDKDLRNGKGSAKELTDVLVVFGDDVVIFSDKHIPLNTAKSPKVAWSRWYRGAVQESAVQLYGAMRWLQHYPNRIFLDAKCTRKLPIPLPPRERARYHLVAMTRGSLQACAAHSREAHSTLKINSTLEGSALLDHPFTVGLVDRKKAFVHVFEERSFRAVLGELDTISDFVEYLRKREALLASGQTVIEATGEEGLLAAYLRTMVAGEHAFLLTGEDGRLPSRATFDVEDYVALKRNAAYWRRRKADVDSYAWDDMIEDFILSGTLISDHPDSDQSAESGELLLRALAAESRFRRRSLASRMYAVLKGAPRGMMYVGMVESEQYPNRLYVFLVWPKEDDETLAECYLNRAEILKRYCRCAKWRFPRVAEFIGLAFDHPMRDYERGSMHALMQTWPGDLSEKEWLELERERNELGLFVNMTQERHLAAEFPPSPDAKSPS